MKYLFSDKHRFLKISGAVFCLILMMGFSWHYGRGQLVPGSKRYIAALEGKNVPFPHARVVETTENGLVIVAADGWRFRADWPGNSLKDVSYVSFIGDVTQSGKIENIHHIIIHRWFTFKLIISMIAAIILLVYLLPFFGLDRKGIFLREKN